MLYLQVNLAVRNSDKMMIMSKQKISTKNYCQPSDYCGDYSMWPKEWMIIDEDFLIGKNLLDLFTPFINSLIKEGLAVKSIKNHMTNLSVLGAEIISCLNDDDEKNRKLTPKKLLLEYIDEDYGPLVHHWDPNDSTEEAYLKSLDATCRKLYKFIMVKA